MPGSNETRSTSCETGCSKAGGEPEQLADLEARVDSQVGSRP